MIFGDLYTLYWTRHAQLRLKCPQNVHYFWTAHGTRWANREVETITEFEVQSWFDDTAVESKSSAVRAVDTMAAIINWGNRRGVIRCTNPCKNVEKFRLEARDRFLLPDELDRFKAALATEKQCIQDFFWLCLLTGARRGNVMSMRWDEIDTQLQLWRIPAHKHKNGRPHLIPLTDAALAILDRRRRLAPGTYVFPSTGAKGHLVEVRRAWRRILKRAQISDLRIHDLRRTVGSYLAINGESQYIIGKLLGHIDQRSTAIYARLTLDPARAALKNAQAKLL